jgi:hypothetical protein
MSYIRITAIRTSDPSNWSVPKRSFGTSEPFGMVMDVEADPALIPSGLRYDAVLQVLNMSSNLNQPYIWWNLIRGVPVPQQTVDRYYTAIRLRWARFIVGTSWPRFEQVTSHFDGSPRHRSLGVFQARGFVSVVGSDLFSVSELTSFKVR